MGVTHLALDFSLRGQRCNRVDHDHVDSTRTHQHVRDLKRLLARIRLGDQQIVGVHAELAGVVRVEGVLGIDERRDAACALRLRNRMQGNGRLTGRLRAVDLHDPAAWPAADTKGNVDSSVAGRDGLNRRAILVAQAHDGALAKVLLNHRKRSVERVLARVRGGSGSLLLRCHVVFSSKLSVVRRLPHPHCVLVRAY